ncbi:MAG: hypothetical protein HY651_08705 [Acidobacteria bacterium]|nr:hypothetical protein [Acidobacteriota bacterium]
MGLWAAFLDKNFWQSLVSNFLAVILGATLGIPIAFYIDRQVRIHTEEVDKQKATTEAQQRKAQILNAVRDAISHNQDFLNTLPGQLANPNIVILLNTDSKAIELLIPELTEARVDLGLIREISNYRYELEGIGRMLDAQFELAFGVASALGASKEMRQQIVRSISVSSQNLSREGKSLMASIASQLSQGP